MPSLNLDLKNKINELPWKKATESMQIGIQHKGRTISRLRFGKEYKYYDLASLTKIIFTTSMYMRLVDKQVIKPSTKIKSAWTEFPYKDVRVKDLLSHSAGMPAWFPFYKKLRKANDFDEARQMLYDELFKIKRRRSRKSLYSDIDFFFLRFHLEALLQVPLDHMWKSLARELGLQKIHFCKDNQPRYDRKLYAPTEKCPWRKKTLRGEVHDDNTWTLGGVSTHAGLFGDLNSVLKYTSHLRSSALDFRGSLLSSKRTARTFLKRQTPKNSDDWAMGFMMPSKNWGSAGKYFSSKSIGHTGFTGTSIWFDPLKDISVVILTNRVHPKRSNNRMKALRPKIHDIIIETLRDEKILDRRN